MRYRLPLHHIQGGCVPCECKLCPTARVRQNLRRQSLMALRYVLAKERCSAMTSQNGEKWLPLGLVRLKSAPATRLTHRNRRSSPTRIRLCRKGTLRGLSHAIKSGQCFFTSAESVVICHRLASTKRRGALSKGPKCIVDAGATVPVNPSRR
jgi:hypothetical protein